LGNISIEPTIIGATTIFLPGVAITNAARDILSGDMLSGLARGLEAFMAAIAIALGVGIMLEIAVLSELDFGTEEAVNYPLWMHFVFGVLFTAAFCILFNSPKITMLFVCPISGIAMVIYEEILILGRGQIVACLLGALAVGFLSEFCSRAGKDATTIFIIPCIIPLVPGVLMYQTTYELIMFNFNAALSNGIYAIISAGSIALALVFSATITRVCNMIIQNAKKHMVKAKDLR
jgi:uncharacterized membrane protein YjjB (DUF3815 family)